MVNYEEALKKPFTDLGKLALGIILSLIPVVNWIANGFAIENSGLGKYKPSKKMPEWKDFGDYLIKGLLANIIAFVYMIPGVVLLAVSVAYVTGSLTSAILGNLPEGFLPSIMAGQAPRGEIVSVILQNWSSLLPSLITVAPVLLLGLLLILVATYLSPLAVLNYLKSKRFGKAFDLGYVINRAFTANYFVVWIITGIITIVLSAILSAIPFIGPAIAYFISGIIAWSLFGQVFREK